MKTARDQKQVRQHWQGKIKLISVRITYFRVYDHANGLFQLGSLVNEYVTETVCVTHYGNSGVVLDVSYEGVAPPWDYQIDVSIQGKEG